MKVSETVTIKVKSPLWERREAYCYPIAEFESYTGTVLPSPSWVGADEICISTGNIQFPFRVIEKARIQGYSPVQTSSKALETSWSVPGSKPGTTYLVTREGSRWACNCVAFGYRRACSHIVTAKAKFEGTEVSTNPLKSQQNKKMKKSANKCCLNTGSVVESNSRKQGAVGASVKLEKLNMAKSKSTVATVAATKSARGSKTINAIAIMNANATKTMAEVIALIAADSEFGGDMASARHYYQYMVRNDRAAGKVEKSAKAPKAVKAKVAKVKADKIVKLSAVVKKVSEKFVESRQKTDADLAVAKKNLETMKAVTAKHKKYSQIAREEGPGVENFDPTQARAEVDNILAEMDQLDSFKSPSKLTRDEVKYMV